MSWSRLGCRKYTPGRGYANITLSSCEKHEEDKSATKNVQEEDRERGWKEHTLGLITLFIWFFMHYSSLPALRRHLVHLFILYSELKEVVFTKG